MYTDLRKRAILIILGIITIYVHFVITMPILILYIFTAFSSYLTALNRPNGLDYSQHPTSFKAYLKAVDRVLLASAKPFYKNRNEIAHFFLMCELASKYCLLVMPSHKEG